MAKGFPFKNSKIIIDFSIQPYKRLMQHILMAGGYLYLLNKI